MIGAPPLAWPAPARRRPALAGAVAAGHLALAWAVVAAGTALDPAAGPAADPASHPASISPSQRATASPRVMMAALVRPQATEPSKALPPRSALPVPRPALPAWATLPVPAVAVAPTTEPPTTEPPFGEPPAVEARRPASPVPAETAPRPSPDGSNGPAASLASAVPTDRPAEPPRWVAARHAHCAAAVHPAALRERGVEGRVHLRVKVGADGRAQDVQVQAGSGWRLFDDAAQTQARHCRFIPAMQEGRPVESWVEYPVRFALSGARSGALSGAPSDAP